MASAQVEKSNGIGFGSYFRAKIEELEIKARDKQHNLRRLEAQRNELNTKGALDMPEGFLQASFFAVCRGLACTHPFYFISAIVFLVPCIAFELNLRAVRLLREELHLLQEPGSYVGEVVKVSFANS